MMDHQRNIRLSGSRCAGLQMVEIFTAKGSLILAWIDILEEVCRDVFAGIISDPDPKMRLWVETGKLARPNPKHHPAES